MITRRRALASMAMLSAPLAATANEPIWSPRAPRVPQVDLVDHQGRQVAVLPLLSRGPVAVNFIYTGCVSFCPPQTAIFRDLQRLLQADARTPATLISISIDPRSDSPAALARYAERFQAKLGDGEAWHMLTGPPAQVEAVLGSFGVDTGSIADHPSQVWLGCAARSRWARVLGLASARELARWLRASAA